MKPENRANMKKAFARQCRLSLADGAAGSKSVTDREQVEALIARVEHKMLPAAQAFINQHFGNDGSKPQISIPADRDGDSDLILIGGLRELQNTLRTLLRERDAAEALANERAADAAGRIGWHCVSCGHVCKDPEKDLETLRKAGARSCCPEREMEPLSETLNAALATSPNALAEHDAKLRAEERERCARIADRLAEEAEKQKERFRGGSNPWDRYRALAGTYTNVAVAIREQAND